MPLDNLCPSSAYLVQALNDQLIVLSEDTISSYGNWCKKDTEALFEFNAQANRQLFTFRLGAETTRLEVHVPPEISIQLFDTASSHQQVYFVDQSACLQHVAPANSVDYQFNLLNDAQVTHLTYGLNPHDCAEQVQVCLAGENARVDWRSCFVCDGSNVSTRIRIEHEKPHTYSNCCVKTVLNRAAQFTFSGDVTILPGAKYAQSTQNNFNYLLSGDARVFSSPKLNIHNKYVSASHGSATQKLDEAALFYLQSRGLSYVQAQQVLLQGFLRPKYEHLSFIAPFMDALLSNCHG